MVFENMFPGFVYPKGPGSKDTLITMHMPASTQILIYKYHFLSKESKTPWRDTDSRVGVGKSKRKEELLENVEMVGEL